MLDFFFTDSLHDMCDVDIRAEIATVVGGANEFSSLMNYELPSLDLGSNSTDSDLFSGKLKWSSSSNDICADVGACVNPNSILPATTNVITTNPSAMLLKSPKTQQVTLNRHHAFDSSLVSPYEKKSHLTFSPSTIKLSQMHPEINNTKKLMSASILEANRENVKKDLSDELVGENTKRFNGSAVNKTGVNGFKVNGNMNGFKIAQKNLKLNNNHLKVINNTITNVQLQQNKVQRDSSPTALFLNQFHTNGTKSSIHKNGMGLNGSINKSNSFSNNSFNVNSSYSSPVSNGNIGSTHTSHQKKQKQEPQDSGFPKPAYSYSCLIALALKNSRAGSLPVSEIYSFMCEHFPFFKSAPSGWKNSVRHNLSLNKCFEKIEKPVTNGGQRKGCLWAMNPSKISKMDEEVQKWSRKDPMAIKKAMVCPDNLELLERGEMKHGHSGESDDEDNDIGSEENDGEVEDESYSINTPESCDNRPLSNPGSACSNEDEEEEIVDKPDVDLDLEVS